MVSYHAYIHTYIYAHKLHDNGLGPCVVTVVERMKLPYMLPTKLCTYVGSFKPYRMSFGDDNQHKVTLNSTACHRRVC